MALDRNARNKLLARLKEAWGSNPRSAGGEHALAGFDYQFLLILLKMVERWLALPADERHRTSILTEYLSDILDATELDRVIITQVKLTQSSGSVRAALDELWAIYQLALQETPALVPQLEFQIVSEQAELKDVGGSVQRWSPQSSPAPEVDAFRKAVHTGLVEAPRTKLLELLAGQLRSADPQLLVQRWLGMLIDAGSSSGFRRVAEDIWSDLWTLGRRPTTDALLGMLVQRLGDQLLGPASGDGLLLDNRELVRLRDRVDWERYLRRGALLAEIDTIARREGMVWIVGPPGSGKTYLLVALGQAVGARYTSLKRKSLAQVTAQLVGQRAGLRIGKPVLALTEAEALAALQDELASGKVTFLLDDADQNLMVAEAIAGLEAAGGAILFAARTLPPPSLAQMATMVVPPLSRAETAQFLKLFGALLPPGQFEEVFHQSAGNALYLVCVSAQPIFPLPPDLEVYHQALFEALSPQQQELASLIALSRDHLRLADLHELLSATPAGPASPAESRQLLAGTRSTIGAESDGFRLFHPSYAAFIRAKLNAEGVATFYHLRLGELALRHGSTVAAAHHLSLAGDARADELLADAAFHAFIGGDLTEAQRLAERRAELAAERGDQDEEASAHLLIANILSEVGNPGESVARAERALLLWKEGPDSPGGLTTRAWLACLALARGEVDEALADMARLCELTRDRGDRLEGMISLNYSFALLRRLPRAALTAAQRALAIASAAGDGLGVSISMANIAAAYGQLDEHAMQAKFASEALAAARRNGHARAQAVALNNLATATRHLGDLDEAERLWREAIKVCHQHRFLEARLLGIACLGNTLKDRGDLVGAGAAYRESLEAARRLGLRHQEAFSLELLGRLSAAEQKHEEAVAFYEDALRLYPTDSDRVRLAAIYQALGYSYGELGRSEEAARGYAASGAHYERAEMFSDAVRGYFNAAKSSYDDRNASVGFDSSLAALRCALADADGSRAAQVLGEIPETVGAAEVAAAYLLAIDVLCAGPPSRTLETLLVGFVLLARRLPRERGRELLQEGLAAVASALAPDSPRPLANALALALMHAGEGMLTVEWLISTSEALASRIEPFYFHRSSEGHLGWTVGLGRRTCFAAQFLAVDEEPVARVALAIALLFHANDDHMVSLAGRFGPILESGWKVFVITQAGFETHVPEKIGELRTTGSMCSTVTESLAPRDEKPPPTFLILHDDYEATSDPARDPSNKSLPWLLLNMGRAFVNHFTRTRPGETPKLARACREMCEHVLVEFKVDEESP